MNIPAVVRNNSCCRRRFACLLVWAWLAVTVAAHAGLVHRWSFSEASGTNLIDSVGVANGWVVVNGATDYSRGAGYVRLAGGAWATVDFMQMPSNMIHSLTNVTMEIWATPRAVQNWSRIFDFGPGNGTVQANDFYLSFCIGTSLNQQRMEHDPAPAWRVDTGLATTANTQYHYVVTWSKTGGPSGGGFAAWYRDGVLAGSVDTGARSVTNVNDTVMWLGRSQFTGDNVASADYNEVRIYSHALGTNEINFSRVNGPDTYIAPTNQASAFTMTTNANSFSLAWTPGVGSAGSVVVMRAGAATSMQPNYGTNYTGSNFFGNGQNLGGSNYVVFAGAGSSVTVTNLIPGVQYFAAVYSYTGSGTNTVYNLADAPTASQFAFGVVQSISLSVSSQIPLGSSAQPVVLANYVGGVTVDVSGAATFLAGNTNVLTVATNGKVQSVNLGSSTVTATFQSFSATNTVTVVDPLLNNLRHRYPFTTDASDVVGTAHGTLTGGASIAGNQVVLDGASGYVSLPTGIVATYTNFTIEAWVSNSVAANWARIMDFGSSATVNMFLTPTAGGGPLRFAITLAGGGGEQQVSAPAALPVGVMKHVVVTLNGNVGILYLDGVAQSTNNAMTLTPSSMGSTTQNYLGKSQYADPYLNGSIDEFRLYDAPLPASLVMSNFLNGPNALAIAPPTTVNDVATLNPGAQVLIPVLANDQSGTPPVASTLQIVSAPVNGSAVVNANSGKILYTHNGSATLSDSFTYRVQNYLGSTSAVATVALTINSSLRLAAPTMAMPATPPATGYQIVDAFPGLFFEDAVAIHTPLGRTNQIFVVERRGRISYVPDINATTPQRLVFLDVTGIMSFDDTAQGERGLLGLAFHPGFQTNGFFFVFYTANGSPYFDRVARYTADPVALTVNTNTQQILFDVVDQDFNHNGGDLHFGPDGYLYIGTGDEGSQYNARLNSQRIDKDLFSALLRIDVDKKPGSVEPKPSANTTTIYTNGSGLAYYSIPPNNPFVNATNYLGSKTNVDGSLLNTNTLRMEIFATGFRHIWRFSIDTNGEVWVGDVGQDTYEEVDIATNGMNYGWSYFEALTPAISLYPAQTTLLTSPPAAFTNSPPLWFYPHTAIAGGDAQYKGNSISGGVVYHGGKIPELNGSYIVADFESGNVWSLRRTNGILATNRIAGKIGVAAFGLDPGNGDVLLANYLDNQIQRLVKVDTGGSTFPQKLSDTGAFADLATLAPNPGIVNYDPIVAFWSDNAIKRRWFCLPDLTNTFTHSETDNWSLPVGAVWVKHFDFEMNVGSPASRRRLETRFIIKSTNGVYGVSYMWNTNGDEAYLVPDGGTNFSLTVTNGANVFTQQWSIPSRSECLACHVPAAGHALSFNTRELNQSATMNNAAGNQLSLLSAAGYLANPISAPQFLPAFARATDTNYSLEYRVRSYLAVNCVQCHQPAGAGPSTWDARPWLTLDQTSLINGTPYNNGANPANKLVIPGDTAHSIVLQRIRGNGFSRMPPLATAVIDAGATNLLNEWITTTLTNRQSFAQWQLANFGSTNAANALAAADPDGDGANNYYEYLTQTSPLTNNPPPWKVSISLVNTNLGVNFLRLANRAFLVEASTNFSNWSTWNVPGNSFYYGAFNQSAQINGGWSPTNPPQYFRVKIFEP
ncbi:MAG: hypothetical protein RL616_411 [Verrucomicrobiota bacterium]